MFGAVRRMARKLARFTFLGFISGDRSSWFGGDPHARVPARPRRGRGPRSGAIAIAEPDDENAVIAVARRHRR
jgi:hypothetical protein